ncbi:ComEC/Rec2 family competence protein [Candidatus Saccharibacteria bacterium]|nr:ComEC/Rec2 family competence protein [Candidatus Saccharibacteria bacterium]
MQQKVYRTTLLIWLFLAILLGLASCQVGVRIGEPWWALPLVGLIMAVSIKKSRLAVVVVALLGGLLGAMQGTAFLASVASYKGFTDRKIQVEGLVKEDPVFGKSGAKQFVIEEIAVTTDKGPLRLNGDLFITTPSSPDITRHDRVRVNGKLRDGFGPFQGSMSFAQVQVIAHEQHPFDLLRSRFAVGVTSVLPEPHASLGLGFVIGMKASLPPDMNTALQQLSLTHVVVASGYNLTVLVRAAKKLREKQSRLQTLLLSLGLIATFLMITGNSPSMIRAGLVSGISLLAWYYGRQMQPLVALLLVMAGTAFVYPPYLWGDIGWWLSFTAFAGILLVVPLVTTTFWPERPPPMLVQIAIEAFVAQLMTLPITLLFFGNLSILGLLANVVIVPLIPLAMLLVAIAGFTDLALPGVAAIVAIPAHAILALIVWIIFQMSAVPWAAIEVYIGPPAMVFWYALILLVLGLSWLKLSRQQREEALSRQIV